MVSTSVLRWVRSNPLTLGAAAAVLVALFAAGALVLSIAEREDSLRKAETGYAELGLLAAVLEGHPAELISRHHHDVHIGPADFSANRNLGRRALGAAAHAEAFWPNPQSRAIVEGVERVARLSARTVTLASRHDFAAAQRTLDQLREAEQRLTTQVAAASCCGR